MTIVMKLLIAYFQKL